MVNNWVETGYPWKPRLPRHVRLIEGTSQNTSKVERGYLNAWADCIGNSHTEVQRTKSGFEAKERLDIYAGQPATRGKWTPLWHVQTGIRREWFKAYFHVIETSSSMPNWYVQIWEASVRTCSGSRRSLTWAQLGPLSWERESWLEENE